MTQPPESEMRDYRYEATDKNGRRVRGVIEAPSRERIMGILLRFGWSVQFVYVDREPRLKAVILSLPFGRKFYSTTEKILAD